MRLLPAPRGTIELTTREGDHRVHERKDGKWCCRVTIKVPGVTRGYLKSWYFDKKWKAYAKLIEVDPTAGRWHMDDDNLSVGDWLRRWLADGRSATGAA